MLLYSLLEHVHHPVHVFGVKITMRVCRNWKETKRPVPKVRVCTATTSYFPLFNGVTSISALVVWAVLNKLPSRRNDIKVTGSIFSDRCKCKKCRDSWNELRAHSWNYDVYFIPCFHSFHNGLTSFSCQEMSCTTKKNDCRSLRLTRTYKNTPMGDLDIGGIALNGFVVLPRTRLREWVTVSCALRCVPRWLEDLRCTDMLPGVWSSARNLYTSTCDTKACQSCRVFTFISWVSQSL